MKLKVHGCRGSIPTPYTAADIQKILDYAKTDKHGNLIKKIPFYGGNTTCFEIRIGDTIIFIDAGSGMRKAGNDLAKERGYFGPKPKSTDIHLFLTHYHHDHLQGLPFFYPAYNENTTLHMYGMVTDDNSDGMIENVRKYLRLEQSTPFFTAPYEKMASKREHTDLKPGSTIELGIRPTTDGEKLNYEYVPKVTSKVTAIALNHPNDVLGYIIEEIETGKKICFSCDCEPLMNNAFLGCMPNQTLARDCDLFIGDGMYTNEDYNMFAGFGHGTPNSVIAQGNMINANKIAITHHNPGYNDEKLYGMERKSKSCDEAYGFSINNIFFLKEGMEIEI